MLHEREHLQRLAQPHVVGQDPAEAVLVEEGQPPEALQLVGPQRGGEADGVGLGDLREVAERDRPVGPRRGLRVDDAQLGQLGPHAEVGRADADPGVVTLAQLGGRRDDLVQPGELRPVEGDVQPAGQDEELVAAGHGREHVGQRDLLTVDAHLHLEVEPVRVVGLLLGQGERDLRGARRLPEVGSLDLRHRDVGQRGEVGEVVEGQGQRVAARGRGEAHQVVGDRGQDGALRRRVAHPAQGLGGRRVAPRVAVGPLPGQGGVRRRAPRDGEVQVGARWRGHLQRPVRGRDLDVPRQGRQRLEEGVVVVGVDHERRAHQQLGQGIGQRLGQVGEEDVVPLDQHQRGDRPPDRGDEVPAPAAVVDLGEHRELRGGAPADEVGRHARRSRAQGERADARAGHQGDAGGHGRAQRRHQAVAVVVEQGRRARHEVGVHADQPSLQHLQGLDLRRHVAVRGGGSGEVRPVGPAACPALACARSHGTQGEVAGSAPRPAGGGPPGDLQPQGRPRHRRPRAPVELAAQPGQPLLPQRLRRHGRGAAQAQGDGRAVLAHPRDRARAGAEDPVGRLVDLGVELHGVRRRGGAPDVGGDGQAAGGLVHGLQPHDPVEAGAGTDQRARVVEPGQVVVGQRVADPHGPVIVAPTADIPQRSSTGAYSPALTSRAPTARPPAPGWRAGRG